MKSTLNRSLAGAIAIAALSLPVVAEPASQTEQKEASVESNQTLFKQISEAITAKPATAAEVVKQAIIESKADAELILQIVKTAVLAAPEQAEAVRKVAIALAPEAQKEVEMVIASVLQGDQVAAENSAAANAARDSKQNASVEPEGDQPTKNTVWLSNYGALTEGADGSLVNSIASKVQNTAGSPNVNHNAGASVRGGTTVIINPAVTTPAGP